MVAHDELLRCLDALLEPAGCRNSEKLGLRAVGDRASARTAIGAEHLDG